MRRNLRPSAPARLLTASVFARPGTPSSRRWPSPTSPTSRRDTIMSWPTMTLPTSARIAAMRSPARVTRSVALPASMLMEPPSFPLVINPYGISAEYTRKCGLLVLESSHVVPLVAMPGVQGLLPAEPRGHEQDEQHH